MRHFGAASLLLALLITAACERSPGADAGNRTAGTALSAIPVPAEFQQGEALFEANCAVCHGEAASGTHQGPPLVHIYYEPNHHADAAFYLAVAQGVRAHHWNFGHMPPVHGLSEEEVTEIIRYLRWLQREAGIY